MTPRDSGTEFAKRIRIRKEVETPRENTEVEVRNERISNSNSSRTPASERSAFSSTSISLSTRMNGFHQTLLATLPARSVSDLTCYRNLKVWLGDKIRAGLFEAEILDEVLSYAQEAKFPGCRNPYAVFMSILRKELGYAPSKNRS